MKSNLERPLVSAVQDALREQQKQRQALYIGAGEEMVPQVCQQQQAAHTAVEQFTDTLYYVSPNLPATYNQAGYEATAVVWTLIGKVKTFPEFGSDRSVAEWRPIAGPVEKAKGAPNYGGGPMVLGDLPADAGQVILKAAEASPNHYSVKAVFPDGEKAYFDVLVCSWRASAAAEAGFFERTANLQFCKYPVSVAAT
jgi:hypothetical protein